MKTTNFLFGCILVVGIIIMAARFMISADVERQIGGLEKRLEARLSGAAMAAAPASGHSAATGTHSAAPTAAAPSGATPAASAPRQEASAGSASTPAKQPAAPIEAAAKGGKTDTPSNQTTASGGTNAAPGGATTGAEPIVPLLASASADRGKNLARACQACHTFDKGGPNRVGPNLWAIVGADKAAHAGFDYSAALKSLPGNWDFEDLNAYLWKPAVYAKGTKMVFAGLPKPQDRADVIAFMRSQHDNPPPLPGGAQPAAASGGSAQPTPTPTPTPPGTTSSSSQSGTGGSRSSQEAGGAAAMPGGSGVSPSSGPASPVAGSGSTGASAAAPAGTPASDAAAKPPTPAANASPGVGSGSGDRPTGETVPTKGAVDKERMTGPSGTPQ